MPSSNDDEVRDLLKIIHGLLEIIKCCCCPESQAKAKVATLTLEQNKE